MFRALVVLVFALCATLRASELWAGFGRVGIPGGIRACALALQDGRGEKAIIVSCDAELPPGFIEEVAAGAAKQFCIERRQLLVAALPSQSSSAAGARLKKSLVSAVGLALEDLAPALVTVTTGPVPALKVEASDGRLRGVLFGTPAPVEAREAFERAHPGAFALFLPLSGSVPAAPAELEAALAAPAEALAPPLRVAFGPAEPSPVQVFRLGKDLAILALPVTYSAPAPRKGHLLITGPALRLEKRLESVLLRLAMETLKQTGWKP